MKIIFSRKGFDSSAGGGPSPIVDGVPVTLPIPINEGPSRTTYGDLGLGEHVEAASRGRYGGDALCHHDPMFLPDGRALLGQCSAAQTHLARNGVGIGDVFLFFGLFSEARAGKHHRIFGYLQVEDVTPLANAAPQTVSELSVLRFPHALAMHSYNDTVYRGLGAMAKHAHEALRLTAPGSSPSYWSVPAWLSETGLSYHGRPDRWLPGGRLRAVSRGQEFVTDIGERADARRWLDETIEMIRT